MSSAHKDFTIVCIAPEHLVRMWPHCGHLFLRGTLECTKGDMEKAMLELMQHLINAQKNLTQFWVVVDDNARRVIAAMTTELLTDKENGKVLWVNRMAGERILYWGHAICKRMIEFGEAERCNRVMFAGRPALKRAYKDVRPIKDIGDGHFLYEGIMQ